MSPPFAINSILSFVNQHAKQSIPYIKTKEELQNFFQISSLGVLAAFEDASETTLPALSEFFFKYYNQLSLSFCDPSLVSKPGFYLYRFEDNAFLECPGLANATNEEEVANVLTPYTVPIIHKLNPAVVDVLETDKQKFIILSLKMSDNYYLTPDQINLAKSLMDDSGFNVTFIPFDYFNLPNSRYGFPDLQKEVMCLIDASGKKVTKYFYSGEVTFEKCAQFIRDVKEGKQKRYLMSAPHQDGKEIEEINAIELQDFTRNEKSILGIYYSDDNCLVPLVESKKTIQKIFPDARIGQFSLYRNDWSGEDTKTIELPRLVLYSKGKLLQNIQLPNTTDAAVRYIIEQYQNMEL
ncbi:hypothetical protein GPJ56_002844 [Histomonas meleagridis]|uniref:uncharacterized protein n=1 Tax=Histomonas meleagridis TaxID=135588 RepID=UPI00355AA52A|nr:hypothetical protein GPJ56_002844 [Histomonas meleagridis]KAH0806360.1 hypothetical protein GO595_001048 [Histomonas meleagridis]